AHKSQVVRDFLAYASERAFPLHADVFVVAESSRDLVFQARARRDCSRNLYQREGSGPQASPLYQRLLSERQAETLLIYRHRRYSCAMRPLRYSINVTLDGCCDHRAMSTDEDLHHYAAENLDQADALLFGRVTYEMMEAAFRPPARTGARPDWMEPFARTIDAAKKYVVSSTLDRVDWNAELVRGDLGKAVQQLKQESGKGLLVGGVKLPLALAELGLIDEYEFVVQPRLAGHGP